MFSCRTAFLDLLLNTALAFACLFVASVQHMRPAAAQASIEPKAEFMLEMTWPDGSLDDIDLWVLLPDGRKVGFNRQDTGLATLDRDDRGAYGDVFRDGDQVKVIRANREVVALRGIAPGRYIVNAHHYNRFTEAAVGVPDEWKRSEVPVKVKLTKINPRIAEIGEHAVTLSSVGQQATVFAFQVDTAGNVSEFATDADLQFVELAK